MKRFLTTVMAAMAAVILLTGTTPARADGTAFLGILTCTKTGEGITYVVFSKFPVACTYQGVGGEQSYTGISGILLGLDLEYEKDAAMVYGVIGGSNLNPGGLAGDYVGAKGSATLGIGPAVQGGLAGAGNGFELVPLGLGGQIGIGATGGLAYLQIGANGMNAGAAAPAMSKFIVYFAFDKSVITPEGKKVVDAAADYYKKNGTLKIKVDGYTDRAGTAQYNMGLSHRRADAVRAALVADGVPANAITEAWHGKDNPAVPTPDGVREPRNRRVEIVVGP